MWFLIHFNFTSYFAQKNHGDKITTKKNRKFNK